MAGNREVSALASPGSVAEALAELVVQNGRLSGARRPLAAPLTLIGHADGCHIRLSLPGVSAFHCALVAGADGVTLEDLKSQTGTFVNGEPMTRRVLKTGDLLSIGPCRFRLRLVPTVALSASVGTSVAAPADGQADADAIQREKEALRIQAAAVAAQQIALVEQERRLKQSKTALEQQESQLASHLEEKRRRLAEFRDQCQEARAKLKAEQEAQAQRFQQQAREMELVRTEVTDSQVQMNVERRRLLNLRRRLKQRLHRHWLAERASIGQRETELAEERRTLNKRAKLLEQQKQAFATERLRLNGEVELSRRQIQAAQDELRQGQQRWDESRGQQHKHLREQAHAIEERAGALADAEQELADEQSRWNKRRLKLEKEVEGLENRINNSRRRLGLLQPASGQEGSQPLGAPATVGDASPSHDVAPTSATPSQENGRALERNISSGSRPWTRWRGNWRTSDFTSSRSASASCRRSRPGSATTKLPPPSWRRPPEIWQSGNRRLSRGKRKSAGVSMRFSTPAVNWRADRRS